MQRSPSIASTVFVVFLACGRAPEAPIANAPVAPTTSAPPTGPYAARALEGPFASVEAYCKVAAKKYEWGPDRRCRLDEKSPLSAPSTSAAARVLHIDDLIAGGAHAATCHLVIVTADGTFVDGPDDPNQRCEGIVGPTSSIDTRFDELAWTAGHLRLRTREYYDQGEWVPHDSAPMTLAHSGTTTDWLVLCSLGPTGVPRCTPKIAIGCSDAQSTAGGHSLKWSLEGAVLRLRAAETASLACDLGEPLVAGDHVVW